MAEVPRGIPLGAAPSGAGSDPGPAVLPLGGAPPWPEPSCPPGLPCPGTFPWPFADSVTCCGSPRSALIVISKLTEKEARTHASPARRARGSRCWRGRCPAMADRGVPWEGRTRRCVHPIQADLCPEGGNDDLTTTIRQHPVDRDTIMAVVVSSFCAESRGTSGCALAPAGGTRRSARRG